MPIRWWRAGPGVYFSTLQIDGLNVPVMGGSPNAPVGPPLLSGHAFDGANQVVLGATTLAQLHKQVGDTVEVGGPGSKPTTLRIVGTATMPSIGVAGSSHLEMGTGALLSYTLIPPGARNVFDVQQPGPNAILVRIKTGANPTAATRLPAVDRPTRTRRSQGDGGSGAGRGATGGDPQLPHAGHDPDPARRRPGRRRGDRPRR